MNTTQTPDSPTVTDVRPFSPRTRTLHDAILTARDHLGECEAEELAAREAVAQAEARHRKAQAALHEAGRQMASYVEAVISDVFSPSLAARLCRVLRPEPDDRPF